MNTARLRPLTLQLWLGLLACLASLLALQASLLPRWPTARPLPVSAITEALLQAGISAEPVPSAADTNRVQRNHEFATSAPLVWRLSVGSTSTAGAELHLMRGSVRQRGNLQAALFTRDRKDLKLERRSLEPGPPPLARGTIDGRDALHTCWVANPHDGGAFGVTAERLMSLVDSQARGWRDALPRLIGLQPNRENSCVLISLRSSSSAALPPGLLPALLNALPAALASPER